MRAFACLAALLAVALLAAGAGALEITQVQHDPVQLDGSSAREVRIRFRVSEPAKVTARIFDGRDLLVRSVASAGEVKGEGTLVWDGKDQAGRAVPAEAYHYTLEARTAGGASVEYDVTDLTGGEEFNPKDVSFDAAKGAIRYVLPSPSRVSIRVGIREGGPLLGTLVDWVARPAGVQEEIWDGRAADGVLDLAEHPKREIVISAFTLPDNTILVGAPAEKVQLIREVSWQKQQRAVKRQPARRMYAHSQQPIEDRGDFAIRLELPPGLPKDDEGVPIVSGSVVVRVDVADADRERALARRFETVFFLDGQYAFENEVGFLPATVDWDLAEVNEGVHYLTTNLRGYEGNFGTATVKVVVRKMDEAEGSGAKSVGFERDVDSAP